MTRPTLQQLKRKYKENTYNGASQYWSPMGNLNINESAKIRFLPYEDKFTGLFWSTAKSLTTYFTNPDNPDEEWKAFIPCLEMYQPKTAGTCAVANTVREIFRHEERVRDQGNSKEADIYSSIGKDHWMNYRYFFQGFVDDGDKTNSNEITPIQLPKTVVTNLEKTIFGKDSNFETLPTGEFTVEDIKTFVQKEEVPQGFENVESFVEALTGREFVVRKSKKDNFANYDSSQWEFKEHKLSDDQLRIIASNGFLDLRTMFFPEQPSKENYEVYKKMMEISLEAALGSSEVSNVWDPAWEEHGILPVKPKNNQGSSSDTSSIRSKITSAATKKVDKSEEVEEDQSSSSIIDKIKNRGAKVEKEVESQAEMEVEEESAPEKDNSETFNADALRAMLAKRAKSSSGEGNE